LRNQTVKDAKSNLVIESAEALYIASAVSKTLDRDGRNVDRMTLKMFEDDRQIRQMQNNKKAAIRLMGKNHLDRPVERIQGTCDENRAYYEHT
jgi:hypothetical protein